MHSSPTLESPRDCTLHHAQTYFQSLGKRRFMHLKTMSRNAIADEPNICLNVERGEQEERGITSNKSH